ncbi:hypothetical protein REPUB_Repub07fG0118400 [Reevesia pubescens]
MGFWGIEVKPGKPHPYHSDNVRGKLHITQATLGLGSSEERTVLQCSVGHKSPIILCSLLPNRNETCSLDLKFDEDDDLVAFSVIGPRSIHLSGYFVADDGDHLRDEYESDSYAEDIAETESGDESSDYDSEDEYDDGFIDDDDLEFFPPSPVPNSGVVIEEIMDDEKPTNGNGESKRFKKKNKLTDSEDKDNSQHQLFVKRGAGVTVLESEDEDGFPASVSRKSKDAIQESQPETEKQKEKLMTEEGKKTTEDGNEKKRKVKSTDEDGQQERKKKKKKKKQKENGTNNINGLLGNEVQPVKEENQDPVQVLPVGNEHEQPTGDRVLDSEADNVPGVNLSEKKKKKKKKKTALENQVGANAAVSQSGDKDTSTLKPEEKQTASKSSQVRTFPNGLVVEELAMGKPDGKRASRGKQVSVHYIGKLKKNGKIFDSNVGRAPFKFRLGIGEVIKGWDVGVEGMRIGDKRKLIIPPSMGYGSKGAGGRIPPNSWLEFDVELVGVR